MIGRLLVGGVAWLAALALFAAALQSSIRPVLVRPGGGSSELARSLDASGRADAKRLGDDDSPPTWAVTRATSALRVLTVDIETERLDDTPAIARHIVEPVRGKYDEILIYVRPIGDDPHKPSPARRVQWTERTGYSTPLVMD